MAIDPCEIVVPRTARYYALGPRQGSPKEIWLVCHGYGQLAENTRIRVKILVILFGEKEIVVSVNFIVSVLFIFAELPDKV